MTAAKTAAEPVSRSPSEDRIADWTDTYFLRTKGVVGRFGDKRVTYAVFMRRPVIAAPRLAVDWLAEPSRGRFVMARTVHHDPQRTAQRGAARCSAAR